MYQAFAFFKKTNYLNIRYSLKINEKDSELFIIKCFLK